MERQIPNHHSAFAGKKLGAWPSAQTRPWWTDAHTSIYTVINAL